MDNSKIYKIVAQPRDDKIETFVIGYYPDARDAEEALLRHYNEHPAMIYEYQIIEISTIGY